MEGLRIRGASPEPNNSNANTPLPNDHTIEPLFSSNEHQYRSHAFLVKKRGHTVTFKKRANRNRGPIYNESRKEIRIYEKLKAAPHWKDYILPLKEARVREKRVTLEFNYVHGGDLIAFQREFIESIGDAVITPSNASIFFKIFADVARALNFLYRHGVAHGDIKPDNIYVAHGSPIKGLLFDFGQSVINTPVNKDDFDKKSDLDMMNYMTIICGDILVRLFELDRRYITDLITALEKIKGRSHQYEAAAAYWDDLYDEHKLHRAAGNSPTIARTRRISRAQGNSPRAGRAPNHVAINMP